MDDDWVQRRDREHLNLLAIFNFVAAGVVALSSFVVILLLGFAGPFLGVFRHVLVIQFLLIVFVALLCLVNGVKLRRQENRTFSMVVAALQCLAVPLGTILGVFTLVVLSRPSVMESYGTEA